MVLSSVAWAQEQSLELSTSALVDENGGVRVRLTLKNKGRTPLYDVHPMFHFHHAMAALPKIVKLEPGRGITLENEDHPPVLVSGRYPLVVMAKYKTGRSDTEPLTQIHTDSFYFREPVESVIGGEIRTVSQGEDGSLLRIFLKNNSASFKNVRLMLLLPPGLAADRFGRMIGFTIRGGEEKMFDVPVLRVEGSAAALYPVHLMIEYAEMLKHYTGEIGGEIDFRPAWNRTALIALACAVGYLLFMMRKNSRRKKTS
ncbi:hypothetical protein UZ36_05365 [Candidatus Nitromaritima sp. SCGC AAA799-C22]|nr:hypothetical protein UZ36_05365 [Candidatus Nitromaritima sp. SCGC AAA799-C22]